MLLLPRELNPPLSIFMFSSPLHFVSYMIEFTRVGRNSIGLLVLRRSGTFTAFRSRRLLHFKPAVPNRGPLGPQEVHGNSGGSTVT